MLGLLWYFGTIAGAFMWLMGSSLYPRLTVPELAVAAVPVGSILGSWVVYLVASCLSHIEHQTMIVSTLLMVYLVGARFGAFRKNWTAFTSSFAAAPNKRLVSDMTWAALIFFGTLIGFYSLYSSRMIPYDTNPEQPGQKAIMSGGSCWADLPIHMHIAESFLTGRNIDVSWGDMHSPIFAGEKMYYPFLPDFHAAVMVKLSGHAADLSTLRTAFLVPGLALLSSFWTLLFLLAVRVTRSRLGGVLACLLTLGSGGSGAFTVFRTEMAANGGNWRAALDATMARDTAQNSAFSPEGHGNQQIFWFAFLPHVMLPQRGANFAYPMVLVVLLLLWVGTDTSATTAAALSAQKMASPAASNVAAHRSFLMHAALFAASLPLVQAHAFIGLGMVIGTVFLLDAHKWLADVRYIGGWLAAAAVAAAVGAPQMALFSRQVSHGAGGRFLKFGWIHFSGEYRQSHDVSGFFGFWHDSLGPALPLFLVSLAALGWEVLQARAFVKAKAGTGALAKVAADAAATFGGSLASPAPQASAASSAAPTPAADDEDKHAKAAAAAAAAAAAPPMVEHLAALAVDQLPEGMAAVVRDPSLLAYTPLEEALTGCNDAAVTGRALDALKLALGGLVVFIAGNYITFQPWDRDNAKLFYLWVFIYGITAGALLAAPFEALAGACSGPGLARCMQLAGAPVEAVLAVLTGGAKKADPKKNDDAPAAKAGSAKAIAGLGALASPVVIFWAVFTGLLMVARESTLYHVMLDQDQLDMGSYIRENIAPKAVMLHNDIHITPSGTVGGRPALVGYTGWTDSHGYNYGERNADREYILANCLKDSDRRAYDTLRRWGVRYISSEHIPRHDRPKMREWEQAMARQAAGEQGVLVPPFDPSLYLDGQLKLLKTSGRYQLLEVLGYSQPPH